MVEHASADLSSPFHELTSLPSLLKSHAQQTPNAIAITAPGRAPLTYGRLFKLNQIAGGKSPRWSLSELRAVGVAMVNYSTPCLFAAQGAIHEALQELTTHDGVLPREIKAEDTVQGCTAILRDNLARRDKK